MGNKQKQIMHFNCFSNISTIVNPISLIYSDTASSFTHFNIQMHPAYSHIINGFIQISWYDSYRPN